MRQRVLGVELTAYTIRLALVSSEARPRLLAGDIFALPPGTWANGLLQDGGAAARAIQGFLLQNKTFSRIDAVAVGIHTPQTVVRPVHLPMLPDKELQSAVEFELSQSFPGIVKTHAISFKEYARAKDGIDCIASFSPLKTLEPFKTLVAELGYKTAYLDVAANCDAKAYAHFCLTDKLPKASLLVNIGPADTRLTIVERGRIRHSRNIAEGDAQLAEELCFRLSITPEQYEVARHNMDSGELHKALEDGQLISKYLGAIVDQIRQTIEFYTASAPAGSLPVAEIVLLGDCALYPGLAEYMAASLGTAVRGAQQTLQGVVPDIRFVRLITALGAAVREG